MAPSPAALLILPGAAVPGTTPLLGLPLERRTALAARRAGFVEPAGPYGPGHRVLQSADGRMASIAPGAAAAAATALLEAA